MNTRVNSATPRKVAKLAAAKGVSDKKLEAYQRRNMIDSSRDHAYAIIMFGGKSYGPCDIPALLEYVNPPKKKTLADVVKDSPRQTAIKEGRKYYRGMPHGPCGKELRFTKSAECVWCNGAKSRAHKEKLRSADPEIEAILEQHGFTMDEILSEARYAKIAACRHQIWQMMDAKGFSSNFIAKRFNRNHKTVMSALGMLQKNKKKQADIFERMAA